MIQAKGWAAQGARSTRLEPIDFEREEPRANEVEIDVLFCGVCHSDIHHGG